MRILFGLFCLLPTLLTAAPLLLESRPGQVSMVELYTSQGCSSCPPADRWLSGFVDDPGLWVKMVPVAFHVDYWDYLGWKDPFANRQNSQRQRRYRSLGHTGSVYTPGFVVNGREWRGWWGQNSLPAQGLTGAALRAEWQEGKLSVRYAEPARGQHLHIALLGFDLLTDVGRGENRNRQLRENFVLLRHRQLRSDDGRWQVSWRDDPQLAPRRALVVWISQGSDPTPLQAAGGWLN